MNAENKEIVVTAAPRKVDIKSIVLGTVAIAMISAACYIPIALVLKILFLIAIVVLLRKFIDDNRGILAGTAGWSLLRTFPPALAVSIPYALMLVPGFFLSFAVDFGLNAAVTAIDTTIAPHVQTSLEDFMEPFPFYDPRGWIGNGLKRSVREVNVLVNAPFYLRIIGGTVRQIIELARLYLIAYVSYVTLRMFCFFFARVFVARQGRIIFCLANHSA